MSTPRIVIQRVRATWSKASRGGEGARRRNALPHALPLPPDCRDASFCVHHVRFSEDSDFKRRDSLTEGKSLADLGIGDLVFDFDSDSLDVQLLRNPLNAAMADRLYPDESGNIVRSVDAFSLAAGQWGRLRYNGRYTDADTGDWSYEQTVYNIGLLYDFTPNHFVETSPDCRFADIARLY